MGCHFFLDNAATTEIYTLSLHDALPIYPRRGSSGPGGAGRRKRSDRTTAVRRATGPPRPANCCCSIRSLDRKSTRLNSSHVEISYAVFCLKKKNITSK